MTTLNKLLSDINTLTNTPTQLLEMDLEEQTPEILDQLSFIFYKLSSSIDDYIEEHSPMNYFEVKQRLLKEYGGSSDEWDDVTRVTLNGYNYWFTHKRTGRTVLIKVEHNKIKEIASI